MAALLSLKIDKKQMAELEGMLKRFPEELPKRLAAALNETMTEARADLVAFAKERYTYSGDIAEQMELAKAYPGRLEVILSARGGSIPMSEFEVSPSGIQRRPRPGGGLSVNILRGGGKPFKHAFVEEMSNGHVGVFVRTGAKRRATRRTDLTTKKRVSPIEELRSPSIPSMLGAEPIMRKFEASASRKLDARVLRIIDQLERGQ